MEDNVYTRDVPPEEAERLKIFAYAQELSSQVLGELKGKSVLDVGAGPGLMLSEYVNQEGGSYVPLDINLDFLKNHKSEFTARLIVGDICDDKVLQEVIRCRFDIIHTRFLLMHLPEAQRLKVITHLVEAAKETAVFLEYDWQSLEGSNIINKFRDFVLGYADEFKIDFYYGAKLKSEILAATSGDVVVKIFKRDNGLYYHELIPLVKATKAFLEKIKAPAGSTKDFDEIVTAIESEANLSIPPGFVPPSVVTAKILKK